MKRNRRAGVEDRWTKTIREPDGATRTEPSAKYGKGHRWNARYVDDHGCEHGKVFATKSAAQRWLDGQTTALGTGTHVAPRDARLTVAQWCQLWLDGYAVHRKSTVTQARTHIRQIVEAFGDRPLSAVRPSEVRAWTAQLTADGLKPSYVYALHSRLSQIMADAAHDGLLGRNPCSRRTSPPMGKPKVYCATTEQVWALYDAVPDWVRPAVLLGVFAGLRIAEAAALTVTDVDWLRATITPERQWPDRPLKTPGSAAPVPVPRELVELLSESVRKYGGEYVVPRQSNRSGDPRVIARAVRDARPSVAGLPGSVSHHDLRHYFASLLIASGADIKTVQARLRHASAKTTLDTYGHLWPDADESTRAAVGAVIRERIEQAQ